MEPDLSNMHISELSKLVSIIMDRSMHMPMTGSRNKDEAHHVREMQAVIGEWEKRNTNRTVTGHHILEVWHSETYGNLPVIHEETTDEPG